jgi:hypothetical protein
MPLTSGICRACLQVLAEVSQPLDVRQLLLAAAALPERTPPPEAQQPPQPQGAPAASGAEAKTLGELAAQYGYCWHCCSWQQLWGIALAVHAGHLAHIQAS